MKSDLIIDGYNLMHAAGLARTTYGPGDLERCRHRLLAQLRGCLSRSQRHRTTVVFDGQGADSSHPPEFRFHGMTIVFSPQSQEADDIIEQLIRLHSAPKRLTVVSSDHRLHRAANARKSCAVDSEQFLKTLSRWAEKSRSFQSEAGTESDEKPTANDPQWSTLFADIDVSEIERSVSQEQRQHESAERQQSKRPQSTRPHSSVSPTPPNVKSKSAENSGQTSQQSAAVNENTPHRGPHSANAENVFDLEFWEKRIAELDSEEYES